MARINLGRISTLIGAPSVLNGIITQIENALDRMLIRDSASPNAMSTTLDMNGQRILNLPTPINPTEPMRQAEAQVVIDRANSIIDTTAGNVAASQAAAAASAGYRDQSQGYSNQSSGFKDQANATYVAFRNIFYPPTASAPATRPDGTAIVNGDLYYNTTANQLYIRSGGNWTAAALSTGGALVAANNLSDLANLGQAKINLGINNVPNVDTTNAGNISSGTLGAGRLPAFTGAITTTTGSSSTSLTNGVVAFVSIASGAIATAANYLAATVSTLLTAAGVWAAAAPVPLTYAATYTPDWNTFINGTMTLTGNITLNLGSNMKPGQSGSIWFTQDGTGGRTLALVSNYKNPTGFNITFSTAAGAVDRLDYVIRNATTIDVALTKGVT